MVYTETFKKIFCLGDSHYKHINQIKLYAPLFRLFRSIYYLKKEAERQSTVKIVCMINYGVFEVFAK